jgi:rhodanese-related sulfurtransferase
MQPENMVTHSLSKRRSVAHMLADARVGLARLSPIETADAIEAGALLVDIRSAAQRAEGGEVPGAIVVERNVLEWRFDPQSDARLPQTRYDLYVIIMCNEGYMSSFAATALQEIGLYRATDLVGGFLAWKAAGMPVTQEPGAAASAGLLGGVRAAGSEPADGCGGVAPPIPVLSEPLRGRYAEHGQAIAQHHADRLGQP